MKLWVKKLLAKYVIYTEIAGYVLVLCFVGLLVVLSRVKAEDEILDLNGRLEIPCQKLMSSKTIVLAEVFRNGGSEVDSGSVLAEITSDPQNVADRKILKGLEDPIRAAAQSSDRSAAGDLEHLRSMLENRFQRSIRTDRIRSALKGTVFWSSSPGEVVEENRPYGVVVVFSKGSVLLESFPAGKNFQKKAKAGQTGTCILGTGNQDTVGTKVVLDSIGPAAARFKIEPLSELQKDKVARLLILSGESVPAAVRLKVGSKSWMQLIWK